MWPFDISLVLVIDNILLSSLFLLLMFYYGLLALNPNSFLLIDLLVDFGCPSSRTFKNSS